MHERRPPTCMLTPLAVLQKDDKCAAAAAAAAAANADPGIVEEDEPLLQADPEQLGEPAEPASIDESAPKGCCLCPASTLGSATSKGPRCDGCGKSNPSIVCGETDHPVAGACASSSQASPTGCAAGARGHSDFLGSGSQAPSQHSPQGVHVSDGGGMPQKKAVKRRRKVVHGMDFGKKKKKKERRGSGTGHSASQTSVSSQPSPPGSASRPPPWQHCGEPDDLEDCAAFFSPTPRRSSRASNPPDWLPATEDWGKPPPPEGHHHDVAEVINDRFGLDGAEQYLVIWDGTDERAWVLRSDFVDPDDHGPLQAYLEAQRSGGEDSGMESDDDAPGPPPTRSPRRE